ncbi:MAG: hypothetical protein E3J72_09850 [Planctomycetota bacterium]|nr:MAG: hypothetical protein E3J72_09850 [Planctomycetota bacterium]
MNECAKTSFSISFLRDGRISIGIAGNLSGSSARKVRDIVRTVVDSGRWKVQVDLADLHSLDSLGGEVLDWIRRKNGEINRACALQDENNLRNCS